MKLQRSLWHELEQFLLYEKKFSDKVGTMYAYRSRFNKVADFFTDVEFTRTNLPSFVASLRACNASTASINNAIKMCKTVGEFRGTDEFKTFTLFKEKKAPNREVLTPEEIIRLANVTIPYFNRTDFLNQRNKALIMFLGTTGCRISEALNLKFSQVFQGPNRVLFTNTKTDVERLVPISQEVYDLIMSLPVRKHGYIFTSYRGDPIYNQHQQINLDLKRRAEAVGITKRVWCHLFRHSYITTMLEQGVDISDVAILVGHAEIQTTMGYKNSMLGHYVDVSNRHPLLVGAMPWEQTTRMVKSAVNKMVDTQSNNLRIEEVGNTITISIERAIV